MVIVGLTDGTTVCLDADKYYAKSGESGRFLVVETRNRNNAVFNFNYVAYACLDRDIVKGGNEDD